MRSNVKWSKAEYAKLLKAVRGSTSIEEAVAAAAIALPERNPTKSAVERALQRGGSPPLGAIAKANLGKSSQKSTADEVAMFASVAKKGGTLEELCDRLDQSPKKVKAMIEAAKSAGYSIAMVGGQVGYVPPKPLTGEAKLVARPCEEGIFAVVSDTHIGSKYCLEDQLRDFINRAYKEDGVRTIFHPGDILDGCYRHSRWEESHHGYHAQSTRATKVFPQLPGLRYVGIIGNHDETFESDAGLSVVSSLPQVFRDAGRSDFELLGARGAYVRFAPKGGRGILVELWHPIGGGAYAVSYKLQRHVEEYGVGQKPDFMFAGHWHQQCYIVRRGVHCFSSGTFHGGGSSFGKALGGAQAIGGWVVRYNQTKDGTVRDVLPNWRGYYETEQVRSLGLG
jgi:predicted phosphodiesterase